MATMPIDPNSTVIESPASGTPPVRQGSDDQRDLKMVQQWFDQAKKARGKYDNDWEKRQNYYMGKQWNADSQKDLYNSKPIMNIIRATIQGTLPILTDQRPGFSVLPKDPTDYQFAQFLTELIETWWDNFGMDHVLIEGLMDMMILDAGVLKVTWDPDAEDGAGEIRVECVDPFDIFVPYGATDFSKECQYVIHRSYKRVGDLKRQFPKMADQIKADASKESQDSNQMKSGGYSDDIHLVSPVDQIQKGAQDGMASGEDDRKTAEVWECWCDDEQLEEYELEHDDGSVEKGMKKKFPRGKLITMLPNQKLILQSVPQPYAHGRKPFIRLVDSILPRSFYGEGEAKVLMPTQRMLNHCLAHMFDYFNMMSNPVWIVEDDAGVDPDTISNRISSILLTGPGGTQKVKRDFAPALQSGIIDFYQLLIRQGEQESGIGEISQGRKPKGVSAAAAIETLQEASQTRIRLKERNMQVSLQQLGMQVIGLMTQFYKEPRVARITNKAGWPSFFEYFIEEPQEGAFVFNRRNYVFDPRQQKFIPEPAFATSEMTKGTMDIKVLTGTAMPIQKTQRANIAFRLFDAGVIDAQNLLETLEWPEAEAIIERMQQQAAAAPPPTPGVPV